MAATQARVARAAKTIIAASPAEHGAGGHSPGVEALVDHRRRADVTIEPRSPHVGAVGV